MTTFQNPLGALMPDEARKELVELLERHDVPLIEDDVKASPPVTVSAGLRPGVSPDPWGGGR